MLIDPKFKYFEFSSPNIKLAFLTSILKQKLDVRISDFGTNKMRTYSNKDYSTLKTSFFKKIESLSTKMDYIYLDCEYGILPSCLEISRRLKI